MKKILLTGSGGFIGKELVNYLSNDEYELITPTSKELSVINKDDWERYSDYKVDYVIHLAGKTYVPDGWKYPELFYEVNMLGTLNALSFCRERNISMVYMSSYIYGPPEKLPVSENDRICPNNPYSCSKYMGEELCKYYAEQFNLNVAALRLFNVYGPGQREDFIIPHILKQVVDDSTNTVEVMDTQPKRDYVYVTDVCSAIKCAIEHNEGFNVYNVGSGESYSVGEIIKLALKNYGVEKEIISKNIVRTSEINDVVADTSKIERAIGWKTSVSLNDGIGMCIKFLKKDNEI